MTVSNGSTITAADLNTEVQDGAHATIAAASGRSGVFQVDVFATALTSSVDATARTRYFTPQDDYEVLHLLVYKDGGAASRNPTVTLAPVGDAQYLPDGALSVTLTAAGAGEESARTSYTTTTGTRAWLLKGVQYKLTVSSSSASDTGRVQGTVLLRARHRPTRREPMVPLVFRDEATLSPDDLNTVLEHTSREIEASVSQRWFHSMCILPFDSIASTDGSAETTIKIRPPFDVDVVSAEFYGCGTSSETFTVSCDATGAQDLAITGAGATTIASDTSGAAFSLAADTTYTWTLAGTGTWTLTRGWVVLHLRGDRHAGSPPTHNITRFADGDSPDASVFKTQATASLASAATTDAANAGKHTIWVGGWRNAQVVTPGEKLWLPAAGRVIDSADFYATDGAATSCNATLYDEAAGSLVALSVTCSTTATLDSDTGNAVGDTQPSDPATAASDYYITAATGAAVDTAYLVVYFDG